jgi:hypothetical protein
VYFRMSLNFLKIEPRGLLNAIFAKIPYDLCANERAEVFRKFVLWIRQREEKRCRSGPRGAGDTIMVKNKSKLQLHNFVWRLY